MDSPTGSTHFWSRKSDRYSTVKKSSPMSSTSNLVHDGKMISANRQSFSSQGCWASINSILGLRNASTIRLPPFQQVVHDGESVQIMCTSEQPFLGYSYFTNWSSTGSPHQTCPHQLIGGSRIGCG